jgi:hypothetical protein
MIDRELTPKQEDLIGDDAYHERKLREWEEKHIPIDPDRFDKILKIVGRKKLDYGEKLADLKKDLGGKSK